MQYNYTHYDQKIIKSGNILEYVCYDIPIKTNYTTPRKRANPKKKPEITQSSLTRTKTNLRRLIQTNKGLKTFITLTFATQIEDLQDANYTFQNFIKRITYLYPNFQYIAVPEFQKSGRVHYHLLTNISFINNAKLNTIWFNGFAYIKKLKHTKYLPHYLTKYITKENIDIRFYQKRKFFTSQNLLRPVVLTGIFCYDLIKDLTHLRVFTHRTFNKWRGFIDYEVFQLEPNSLIL